MDKYTTSVLSQGNYIRIICKEKPEVIHFVRSGFTNSQDKHREWFMFEEDAYLIEPFENGVKLITQTEMIEKYGIDSNFFKVIPKIKYEQLIDHEE